MTVDYKIYSDAKEKFFRKHKNEFNLETSPIDSYGVYHKVYTFEDGAQWIEIMSPEYVTETVEIKFVKVDVSVKMLKTEYWNTDDSRSKYYYEKY